MPRVSERVGGPRCVACYTQPSALSAYVGRFNRQQATVWRQVRMSWLADNYFILLKHVATLVQSTSIQL